MNIFQLYFNLGVQHITDLIGYDHILFLICLTAVYILKQWKQILILITAFTIGHSTSLVLASFDIIYVPTKWVEFLIPVTIFITAFWNLLNKKDDVSKTTAIIKYIAALFFGLIHGLGFSNYLKSLLNAEDSLFMPLLGFNLGIEVGQIAIVAGILLISTIFALGFKMKRREWSLILSGAGIGVSLILMLERWPG